MFHVQLSDSFPRNRCLAGEEDGRSGTAVIYNGQDGVCSSGGGELSDEVKTDRLEGEGVCRCGDSKLGGSFRVILRFILLTAGAALHVGRHPARQIWPPEQSLSGAQGAVSAWVSRRWGVMVSMKNSPL